MSTDNSMDKRKSSTSSSDNSHYGHDSYKLGGNSSLDHDSSTRDHNSMPRTAHKTNATGTKGTNNTLGSMGTGTGSTKHEIRKPSLINKLNPFTDADGDGKKGIMH